MPKLLPRPQALARLHRVPRLPVHCAPYHRRSLLLRAAARALPPLALRQKGNSPYSLCATGAAADANIQELVAVCRRCLTCAFHVCALHVCPQVAVMVLLAWAVPIAIFFPTIMGWEAVSGQPIDRSGSTIWCNVAFANDRLFNFVLTVGYYWTTLVALIVLYVGIYRVALKLHRKSEEKQKRVTNTIFSMAGNNLSKFSVGLTEQATATATSTSATRAQDLRSVFTYTTTDAAEDSFTERSSSELPRLTSAATAAPSRADGLHLAVPSSNAEKSSSTCTASESVELRPARPPPAATSAGGAGAPASESSTTQHSALQHAATMRNTADDIRARRVRLVRHHSCNVTHTALEAIALSPPPVPPQVSLLMQLTRSPDSVPLIRYIDQSSPPSSRDSTSGHAALVATTLADMQMQTQLSDADERQMQQVAVIWQRRVSSSKPEHFDSELSARAAVGGEGDAEGGHRCSNGHDTISRTLSIHSPRYCRSKERLALNVDVYLDE